MPARIKKRFESLVRSLNLETNTPEFVLEDAAVPVVLIHEHCEGECLMAASTISGIQAAQTIVSIPIPTAGAYQVLMYWDSYTGASSQEAAAFYLSSPVGVYVGPLYYFNFGYAANAERGSLLIPKIHINEGQVIRGEFLTALIAGNQLTMGLLVQPI